MIKNWMKMDFTFANVMSSHYPLLKADDVLEELQYKKESEKYSEV